MTEAELYSSWLYLLTPTLGGNKSH